MCRFGRAEDENCGRCSDWITDQHQSLGSELGLKRFSGTACLSPTAQSRARRLAVSRGMH